MGIRKKIRPFPSNSSLSLLATPRSSASTTPDESVAMAEQSVHNDPTQSLQSDDARKLMDTADKLRKAGLGSIVQLPQIVTVGDQSSGKSSTLEAITGIPFPRKENLCTRFPTQIVMRRGPKAVAVEIIPDKLRPVAEQDRLKKVKLELAEFDKLDDVMEEAMEAMGLKDDDPSLVRAFSRDVLNIEISDPASQNLILVDLPGLIHSETKQQSREDVKLINDLVEEYIREERTIVLAVVSAKNDVANQIVLSKARNLGAADRTLGVVTKVDCLQPNTENEKSWLDLAQNKDVFFGLGWHMLRNRQVMTNVKTPDEMNNTMIERNKIEKLFFASGSYRNLDQTNLGVKTLRTRLSKLLYGHLVRELPKLQKELREKQHETTKTLEQLGESRSTTEEQRQYLMAIGQKFERVSSAATDGHYDHEFFDHVNEALPILHERNVVRLRAAVQEANIQFASHLRKYGSKIKIISKTPDFAELDVEEEADAAAITYPSSASDNQTTMLYDTAILWVQNILKRSRGRELPGNFNPLVIAQLFREQSTPWAECAADHVNKVANICETFVTRLLKSLVPADVSPKIINAIVEPCLKARTENAHQELDRIIKNKDAHVVTYNHYYMTTIQKLRNAKQMRKMRELLWKNNTEGNDLETVINDDESKLNIPALLRAMQDSNITQDMDRLSAEDALICMRSYYKDELKFFINCVTKHVIERHLIADLSSEIISSPKFGAMAAEELRALAAEPAAVMEQREHLRKKKETLENGMKQFKIATGAF